MYLKMCTFTLLVTYFVCFSLSKKIPPGFKLCKRNADLDNCLQDAIESALTKLAKDGMPELGIPKLDPLEIPSVTVSGHGSVDVIQNYKNIKIYGLSNGKVTKVVSNLDNYKLQFEAFSPNVFWLSDYTFDGRILVLPFKGEGKCNITFYNYTMTHTLVGEKLEKNKKIYFKVNKHPAEMKVDKMEFNFTNLFGGNKELSDNMHALMNENWNVLLEDVHKLYEDTYALIFKEFDNQIFSKVPMDEIFEN